MAVLLLQQLLLPTIEGAADLQIFLDKQTMSASRVIANSEVDANGNYTLAIPDGLKAGQYRLRIGAKRLGLVFDGNESAITINGNSTSKIYC